MNKNKIQSTQIQWHQNIHVVFQIFMELHVGVEKSCNLDKSAMQKKLQTNSNSQVLIKIWQL